MSDTTTQTSVPSTEVEAFQHGDLEPAVARHLAAQWRESQRLAMTAVVPKSITHKRQRVGGQWQDVAQPPEVVKATVFAVVRYGDVFGFSPAVSLGKIDVIEGRLEPRYDALLGLMIDAGHQTRVDVNELRAILRVRRSEDRGDPEGWQEVSFTAEEAREAGYLKEAPDERERKGAWYTRRPDMLLSKAAKRAFRWITPDVLVQSGAEELIDGTSVEAMVAPVRDVVPDLPAEVDPDDEPVDAEIVEPEHDAQDGADVHDGDDEPVDVEVVDEPEPERGSRLPLPQQIAMRAQEARVDRALVIRAVTDGVKSSGREVTPDEGRRVLEAIVEIKAGRLAVAEIDGDAIFGPPDVLADMQAEHEATQEPPAETPKVTPEPEADEPTPLQRVTATGPVTEEAGWDADAWRKFLASRKVKVTELLREASRLANERGVRPPGTLDDLAADPPLAGELRGFVEDLALERSGS